LPSSDGDDWFCDIEYVAFSPPPAHPVHEPQPDISSILEKVVAGDGTPPESPELVPLTVTYTVLLKGPVLSQAFTVILCCPAEALIVLSIVFVPLTAATTFPSRYI
jgi:hypothetical protein